MARACLLAPSNAPSELSARARPRRKCWSSKPTLCIPSSLPTTFSTKKTSMCHQGPPPVALLTTDLLISIMRFLSPADVCACALVCRVWEEAAHSNLLWHHLYERRFIFAPQRSIGSGEWKRLYAERAMGLEEVLREEFFVDLKQLGLSPFARGPVRLNVVGDRRCGKTAFLDTLVTGSWGGSSYTGYNSRIPVCRTLGDRNFAFFTMDTTDEVHSYLRTHTEPDVNIVCFSLTNPVTFNGVQEWVDALHAQAPHTPVMLVALQLDSRDDGPLKEQFAAMDPPQHISTAEEGLQLAKRTGAVAYFEVSARERRGLTQLLRAMYVCAWNARQHKHRQILFHF
eukprot:comp31212_c0_seq1/m.47251 comp31212_c0_seq1/g.47251  ORF comp31212_c0_seq1/g.47251 comp31212_c0_seq1/m.47251 type:complete len:341 (-) comp31212_c0_seq1:73-1095(-)